MTEETDQLLQDYAHLAIDEVSDLLRRKHGLRLRYGEKMIVSIFHCV